jgi:plasmid stabilization system protein ParE
MRLIWHPLAEDELNDVAAYYEDRDGSELAVAFLTEAQRVATLILQRPGGGRSLRDGVYCWRLRTFPYALVYRDKGDHIRILAVAGDRRRPFYWQKRS